MTTPDAIHFVSSPLKADLQSRPTHLVQVGWTVGDYDPRWVVMLRADDSATIIHTIPTSQYLDFYALEAAENTLHALKVTVATAGVDLGMLPPSAPFNFEGVFPGDKEFAELLTQPEFITWLKSLADLSED